VFTLGNDTTLCERQQLSYNFKLTSATYTWNTGNTSGQQTLTQPGLYWLQVSQQGCAKRDSISLLYKPVPTVSLGNDTTLCEGVSYQLNAITNTPVTYTWQNNSTSASYVVQNAGTYWVRVLLNGCANADTVNIAYKLKPVFDLGGDTMICKGQPFLLQPRVDGNVTYKWQNGSTAPAFTVPGAGTYAVTVTNECGEKSDQIAITEGLCVLIMPNAFSPNHDGVNDVFRIKHPWYIKEFHLVIFNRWGEKVFETSDPYRGWDGNFKTQAQPTGAYVWAITLTDKDGQKESSKGVVVLTR
jgi:gliding motility-associated-like protein